MPIVRTRCKGDRDIVIQKKIPFMPRSWSMSWKDWATLSSESSHIEGEICKHMAKVEGLVHSLKDSQEMLKAERAIVKSNEWGYGPPRSMNGKDFNKLRRNVPDPPLEWRRMLSTHFLKRHGIDRLSSNSVNGRSTKASKEVKRGTDEAFKQAGINRSAGDTTAYTLPGTAFEANGFVSKDVDADNHVEFREPKQNNQQQGKRNKQQQRNNQNRNNQNNRNNQDNG